MLPPLAFVPKINVIDAFNVLVESKYYIKNKEIFKSFLDYFGGIWLSKLNKRE